MHRFYEKLSQLRCKQVPATGLGLFRFFYGLIALQEIIFLLYFNHLIFDPIPYIDVEFPMIPFFLGCWAMVASCVALGLFYQKAIIAHYLIWIIFVNFTPMQRDFDGGFDPFMIGAGFFLLFLPANRAFSLDNLRKKLATPFVHEPKQVARVSILVYYLPVAICLGFLYFDSVIHKMFAPHWRNGLGTWLPNTHPYYVSILDMSPLLNIEWFQYLCGYTILIFQFTFLFFFWQKHARIVYLFIGLCLHLGITLSFNIYPFGLGMLSFYTLLVPFKWWRSIGQFLKCKEPTLTVFFDEQCPLCNRTALIIKHFDICEAIAFKNAQQYAVNYSALNSVQDKLLTDLYALDTENHVYAGVKTYARILIHSRYLALFGRILLFPVIYQIAEKKYRQIADTRVRCDASCIIEKTSEIKNDTLYQKLFENYANQKPKKFARQLGKILILFIALQLNSTIHYGLIYRLNLHNSALSPLAEVSNHILLLSQTFFGIVPHALYLHDHFQGYDHIIAITYTDNETGEEKWLPFINEQGRILAPNWGRVHSMWANIAVTPDINNVRLNKFIMKITAFWGKEIGLDLNKTTFHIQMKKIASSNNWISNQRQQNMQGEWTLIGEAKWRNHVFSGHLPADINSL